MIKKRLLICGGSGFIGRNLVDHFSKNNSYSVRATYFTGKSDFPKNVKPVYCDLRDPVQVSKVLQHCDILIQAAATTSGSKEIIQKPYYHVTDNALMNSLIFRAAHDFGINRVFFFSCSIMYPTSRRKVKETDGEDLGKIHPAYFGAAWTKVYLEKMCEFYASLGRSKYTVLRHSNIYGPYDKFDLARSHVFGATLTKVRSASWGGNISVWGRGTEERDLLYVDDLVRFVQMSLNKQKAPFELVNVGSGRSVSIKELVRRIIELSGKKLSVAYDLSKPSIPTRVCLNIKKAKNVFGWEPLISLDQGILKTLRWLKIHNKEKTEKTSW